MVSRKTVSRISRYRRILLALREEGTAHVYSHELARHAAVSAAQVRRDLMVIGYSGSPSKGYGVAACITSMSAFLDDEQQHRIALVGVGNLGRAILAHASTTLSSASITAAFDTNPAVVGSSLHGCPCFHTSALEEVVHDSGIETAVLALPASAAQSAAEALVGAGIKSIVSFSPIPLHLPDDIFVEYIDIIAALESAVFFSHVDDDGENAVALESLNALDLCENYEVCSALERPLKEIPL